MLSCQKELSDFSAEKQIFDPASLLRYLSAAADNPSASPSFHLTFFGARAYVFVCLHAHMAPPKCLSNIVQQSLKAYTKTLPRLFLTKTKKREVGASSDHFSRKGMHLILPIRCFAKSAGYVLCFLMWGFATFA